jgi:transposase
MARLLSQQEDFVNEPSMLETVINEAGRECLFLPKFHCELNPIEMVNVHF